VFILLLQKDASIAYHGNIVSTLDGNIILSTGAAEVIEGPL
jgi:hypothetical protein